VNCGLLIREVVKTTALMNSCNYFDGQITKYRRVLSFTGTLQQKVYVICCFLLTLKITLQSFRQSTLTIILKATIKYYDMMN